MPLLYPGFKGVPDKQPFIDIHDWFYERLNQADIMFVIGFAFRDQYINNIFDFSLKKNKNLIVLCINPCPLDKLPPDSKLGDFLRKYPDNFFHIQTTVEVKDNPLNLKKLLEAEKVKKKLTEQEKEIEEITGFAKVIQHILASVPNIDEYRALVRWMQQGYTIASDQAPHQDMVSYLESQGFIQKDDKAVYSFTEKGKRFEKQIAEELIKLRK